MPLSLRNCDSCTACCDGWLKIKINGQDVRQGKPCPHSNGTGCLIYEQRPVHPCVQFTCAWKSSSSPLPEWMKPDAAKVIVLAGHSHWRGLTVDLAVPVGKIIPQRSLLWLKQFAADNNRPLMWTENRKAGGKFTGEQNVSGFGPVEFQQQIRNSFIENTGNTEGILESLAIPSPQLPRNRLGAN